jgi:hypothetical protein
VLRYDSVKNEYIVNYKVAFYIALAEEVSANKIMFKE